MIAAHASMKVYRGSSEGGININKSQAFDLSMSFMAVLTTLFLFVYHHVLWSTCPRIQLKGISFQAAG